MALTYQVGSIPRLGFFPARPSQYKTGRDLMRHYVAGAARRFDVAEEDIMGDCRLRPVVRARWFVMWSLYQLERADGSKRFTLPHIARMLGKDHTTILHGIRRWEEEQGHWR